ncbi:MAG: bifunctional tetrahydrofolate synthase/dihydrofolate synthase [Deltaproteobacteria bacterium]|jgi:dihydrofolate synthase/folylpolyglutamate synthase|nr:bifunctional tetrahydrofolate synthase/dihydrofolate synthase [Deltaproteobacteria bacterium]
MSRTPYFQDWGAFSDYLDNLGLFRMQPGLERMEAALAELDLKRAPHLVVQGVGTNGKGSTCTFLASLARAHGLVCGLHSSPHFVSVRERVRLFRPSQALAGGELLPESAWLEAANQALGAPSGPSLTYFELVTLVAVLLLRRAGVDLAVLESGLGGSFDATTALDADLVFFTPIDLDHRDVLGRTLAAIAADKAGAMRLGAPALSARQKPEARRELEKKARRLGADLEFLPEQGWSGILPGASRPGAARTDATQPVSLGLAGEHQYENAALALAVWRRLRAGPESCGRPQDEAAELEGLRRAWLPGRLQKIAAGPDHPPLLLDGAHNRHGLAALGLSLARLGLAPLVTVFTCLRDKEPDSLLPHLRALSAGRIIVPELPGHPRAMPARDLAGLIGPQAVPADDLRQALGLAGREIADRLRSSEQGRGGAETGFAAGEYPLLVCGSLYLLAEFFKIYPEYLAGPGCLEGPEAGAGGPA